MNHGPTPHHTTTRKIPATTPHHICHICVRLAPLCTFTVHLSPHHTALPHCAPSPPTPCHTCTVPTTSHLYTVHLLPLPSLPSTHISNLLSACLPFLYLDTVTAFCSGTRWRKQQVLPVYLPTTTPATKARRGRLTFPLLNCGRIRVARDLHPLGCVGLHTATRVDAAPCLPATCLSSRARETAFRRLPSPTRQAAFGLNAGRPGSRFFTSSAVLDDGRDWWFTLQSPYTYVTSTDLAARLHPTHAVGLLLLSIHLCLVEERFPLLCRASSIGPPPPPRTLVAGWVSVWLISRAHALRSPGR